MSVYEERWYQEAARQAFFTYFENQKGHPILAMPTASGKGFVIAKLAANIFHLYPTTRLLVLTHVKELIRQNAKKLREVWPMAPLGIYSDGLKRKEIRPITMAGIASIHRKANLVGHVDLVFIDECHLISPVQETTYRKFLKDLTLINPRLKVVGFTATPYRLKQGMLTDPVTNAKGQILQPLFTDICYDITKLDDFNRLIDEGFLSPLVVKKPDKEIDLSQVGTVASEFNQRDLQAAADRSTLNKSIVGEIVLHALFENRQRWLIFSSGVEHAKHLAEEFAAKGFDVRCVVDECTDEERDEAVEWFEADPTGSVRVLVNNRIFTTGFDVAHVDLIGVATATKSTSLWVQMLGRGTRRGRFKTNCLVLDFGGNTRRLGKINDPILPNKKSKKGGPGVIKVCPVCATYNHGSARFCEVCKTPFEFEPANNVASQASDEEVMQRGKKAEPEAPIMQIFPVTLVTYDRHRKKGAPDSLRVTYTSGVQSFMKYVCLEHQEFAGKLAREWWRKACKMEAPKSVSEALDLQQYLTPPTHIRVWFNAKPYPKVMAEDYTGTAFGTLSAEQTRLPL